MTTYRKKICLIGDFAVGKTSLVKRYVENIFSEDYMSTVGVSIVTREVQIDRDALVKLVIWDIAGADRLSTVSRAYLSGANGYILVADGTRAETLETALELKQAVDAMLDKPRTINLINKHDLTDDWEIAADQSRLEGWNLTSAKTGEGVEEAFLTLARAFFDDVR